MKRVVVLVALFAVLGLMFACETSATPVLTEGGFLATKTAESATVFPGTPFRVVATDKGRFVEIGSGELLPFPEDEEEAEALRLLAEIDADLVRLQDDIRQLEEADAALNRFAEQVERLTKLAVELSEATAAALAEPPKPK